MKILILHNQLWSQYKSIVFENINNLCRKNGDELLVLQTSISETSRKDLIDFDINNFNYRYNFILLNNKYLESTNSLYTTFKWLKYILIYKPDVINLTGYSELGTLFVLLITKILNIKTIITNESVFQKHSADFDLLFYIRLVFYIRLFYINRYPMLRAPFNDAEIEQF